MRESDEAGSASGASSREARRGERASAMGTRRCRRPSPRRRPRRARTRGRVPERRRAPDANKRFPQRVRRKVARLQPNPVDGEARFVTARANDCDHGVANPQNRLTPDLQQGARGYLDRPAFNRRQTSVPLSGESAFIRSRGVLPFLSLAAGSAPASSSILTIAGVVLRRAAMCRGVCPKLSRAFTSAPAFTSAATTPGVFTIRGGVSELLSPHIHIGAATRVKQGAYPPPGAGPCARSHRQIGPGFHQGRHDGRLFTRVANASGVVL